MSIGFQQTEDLWCAMQQENEPSAKRLLMIELAKFLLKYAALEGADIERVSGTDRLTDFFIEYLDTAKSITGFFHSALPHLEHELLGSEFEVQIKTSEEELKQIVERSETLRDSNEELMGSKNRLMEESQRLTKLETELDLLKKLEKQLQPENLSALEKEIDQIKEKTADLVPEKKRLEVAHSKYLALLQKMEGMTSALQEGNRGTIEHLRGLSEDLSVLLDQNWDMCDMDLSGDLRKLKQRNKMYREIIGELDECIKKLNNTTEAEKVNHELYDRHFAANTDTAKMMNHTSVISDRISQDLKQFDLELKKIIEAEEELVHRIRRLNKTV